MSSEALSRFFDPLVGARVQFVALEWDFPRLDRFPPLPLTFFTIFRDPVERFLSNYAYDRENGFSPERSIAEYEQVPSIWRRPNYYTRFFSALGAEQPVRSSHVDDAATALTERFRYAFFGEDLLTFLQTQVGLPIRSLRHVNRTGGLRRLIWKARIEVSEDEQRELRSRNGEDYELLRRLEVHRRTTAPQPAADMERSVL